MDPVSAAATGSQFRDKVSRALAEKNPFYLMSAASMLLGCLLLTNSLSWSPIEFTKLLVLLGTLNLYELLLFILGWFLLSKKGEWNRRDASQVLFLGFVFLTDAAFLVSESVSTHLQTGLIISIAVFLLAMIKAAVTLHVLHIRISPARWASIASMLLALFGLPVLLKYIGDTRVSGLHLYAAWWGAALLWAFWDVVTVPSPRLMPDPMKTRIPLRGMLVVVPWLSLLTHVGIMHYVYGRHFSAAHATPLLLAFALIVRRLPLPADANARQLQSVAKFFLPLAAIFVSANPPGNLEFYVQYVGEITPAKLALVGAYLTYAWIYLPSRFIHLTAGGVVGVLCYILKDQMVIFWNTALNYSTTLYNRLVNYLPKTSAQWGVVAVTGSFVLLGIGARISLSRVPPSDLPPTDPNLPQNPDDTQPPESTPLSTPPTPGLP